MINKETIVALSTAPGAGAIGIVRLSGEKSLEIADQIFFPHKKGKLSSFKSHTVHLGYIKRGNQIIDEALSTIFKGKNSYTGEPVVEFSCHGSRYIEQEIIKLCIEKGATLAKAGEFTLRAFINGKMDLSSAEAVADLISADNEASHKVAMSQIRGGFANEIKILRQKLIDFASLIELELDFSEEDVEFANKKQFQDLVIKIQKVVSRLIDSFAVGNVIKNGIQVAIVGEPNVGKSTLLNALLNEERAIVSPIAGTTRDTIEDEISIGGVGFRFIDTAGVRKTKDEIESLGIKKTFEKIEKAQIVLLLVSSEELVENMDSAKEHINQIKEKYPNKNIIIIANKADTIDEKQKVSILERMPQIHFMSAQKKEGIKQIEQLLIDFVNSGLAVNEDTIVTNLRHYEALIEAQRAINEVQKGITMDVTSDLLAIDIREALYYLGEITGEITNKDLLDNIFSKFCIGK